MRITKPEWLRHDADKKKLTAIFSLDFHPSGTRLATGGMDNKVRLWSTTALTHQTEPRLLSTLTAHSGAVMCTRFSPTGKYLATGADDMVVLIWEQDTDTATGNLSNASGSETWRPIRRLTGHESDVCDLAWSDDRRFLATCGLDNIVYVWDAKTFDRIAKLQGHSQFVKGVTFDPAGKYVATQSDDKTLKVWRTSDWKLQTTVSKPFQDNIFSTYFRRPSWSPDGDCIATANAANGKVPVAAIVSRGEWNADLSFVGHRAAIEAVRFNPRVFRVPPPPPPPPAVEAADKETEKKAETENHEEGNSGLPTEPGPSATEPEPSATEAKPPVSDKETEPVVASVCAAGGQDRGVTVWLTSQHMPIAATTNLFTGNLLDLAWHTFDTPHSTGKNDGDDEVVALLAACSYDGTVALLEFTKNELGTPIQMHEQEQMLVKYGWTPRSSAKRRLAIVDSDDDDDSDDGARAKRPRPIAETVTQLQLEEQAAQTEQPEQPMPVQTAQTTQIAQTETKHAQQALPVQMPVPIRTKDGKKRVAPVFIRALGSSSSSSSTNSSSTNAVAVAAAPAAAVPTTTVTTIVAPAPTDSEPVAAPAWIEARVLGTRILSSSPAPAHSISVISHAVTPLAPQSLVHAQTISAARVHLNVPKIVAHISRSVSDADSLTLVATNQGTSKPQLTCSGTPNANAGNDGSGGGSQHSDPLWTKFFDAPIVALAASNALTAASLADGSLHFLDTQSGARLLAPLIAEAHPSHIACRDHFCLVLDSVGQLSVWDLARTSAVLTNISVAPLLYSAELACKTPSPTNSDPPHRHPPKVAITKIDLAPDASPIISLSDGRAFSFHRSLRAWLRIADPASYRGSDFATLTTPSRVLQKLSDANCELAAISPASSSSSSSMPLARLQELGAYQLQATTALNLPSTKSKASSSHAQQQNTARLSSEVRRSVTVDHAEHQLVAAEFLQSSDEVIKWCDVLMRQLAKIGDTKRAAYWLAYLLGPPLKTDDNAAGGGSAWKPEIAAVSKHQLLKRALPILSANRHLQSLVAEYSTALC